MKTERKYFACFVLLCIVAQSCSNNPIDIANKHSKLGDGYVEQGKYKDAVIEYKNALKARSNDSTLRWKLANAALNAKDFRTAYEELSKVVDIDPNNYDAKGKLGELYIAAGRTADGAQIADNLVRSRPEDPMGYILKSGLAVRAGNVDEAITYLKMAAEREPENLIPLLNLGNLYFLKQDREKALEWYNRALSVDPESVEVQFTLGNFYFATGENDAGEKAYRKAIGLSQGKENLRIMLAEHYLYQGRMEDSEKELDAVIQEMNSQRARKLLAEIKIETGQTEAAKGIVDSILNENGKDLDGKYLKGRIALAEKRFAEAKALFEEVIKEDAGVARAHLYKGLAEIFQGQIEAGRKEVVEAVRLDPEYMKAHLVLADLYLKSNAPAAAEKEVMEVLRRNPMNLQAIIIYGDSLLLRKNWKKAEEVYGAIVRQLPDSPVGYFKMGMLKKTRNMPQEAALFFSRAIDRNPNDLNAINEYIFALLAAGKPDEAESRLDWYLGKEPKNPLLWELAGRFQLARHKNAEAERSFLKSIELAPTFIPPYYQLGILYVSQKKLPEAEVKFREVLKRDDKNMGVRTLLGIVLNNQGKIEEANEEYRKVLAFEPKNALVANNLAANLTDHGGNLDEALKFAQTAREIDPDNPGFADTLGWIYYRKGLFELADPLISNAARKLRYNATVRYHYGMVLAKMGKGKEASLELQAALEMDGNFHGVEEAKKTLADIH